MSKKQNTDHVVMVPAKNSDEGTDVKCMRCGARETALPPGGHSVGVFAAICAAFTKDHAKCKGPLRVDPTPKDPGEWARGDDTGSSSATIWSVMTGRMHSRYAPHGAHPYDPSDFGRCHRLLELFPEWRARMPEVAKKYKLWARLVDQWDALTALYVEELPSGRAPKLYAAIQACIKD